MAVKANAASLRPLLSDFFDRDADVVAEELLGVFLFTFDKDGNHTGGMIVETEAYDQWDLAAHCYMGEGRVPPESSRPMFFEGGHAYLYYASSLLCLNFVCDKEGFGSAVLIRALEPVEDSLPKMTERRKPYGPKNLTEHKLCNGPGVLCEALGLCNTYYKRSFTKLSLYDRPFDLRLGTDTERGTVICGPRIGIKRQMARKYQKLVAVISPEVTLAIERKRRWGIRNSPFLSRPF